LIKNFIAIPKILLVDVGHPYDDIKRLINFYVDASHPFLMQVTPCYGKWHICAWFVNWNIWTNHPIIDSL